MLLLARFRIQETWKFCVIMFLDLFGAKYAVEPLYGSTYMVHCGAHDAQAVFLLNKVIFGVSANIQRRAGIYNFPRIPILH